MSEAILRIEDLTVSVGGKRILNGVNLSVRDGEVVCLFGPNGAGKSTLLYTILGYPGYTIDSGRILFKGVDVSTLTIDERVRMGLGIAFQHAPRLRGVKLIDLIHLAADDGLTEEEIEEAAARLRMSSFLHRDVNYGFSGGEIKRSEILQLLAARSDFLLLDEPDSGVDVESVELLGREINQLLRGRSGLIITHVGYILNFIRTDRAVVLYEGKVACEGDPFGILKDIKDKGYKACLECDRCSPPTRKE